jgi:hypothetical protein
MNIRRSTTCAAMLLALGLSGCATLAEMIQPPRFSVAGDRQSELRLLGPSAARPLGGAAIRIWAHVQNPNAIGITLTQLTGDLVLEGTRAAGVEFPLGVPLVAAADTVIPLDISLSFADLPGLADVFARVITRNVVAYRLDGTLAVDAGVLGEPRFGPSTWLAGEMPVFR